MRLRGSYFLLKLLESEGILIAMKVNQRLG